MSLNKNNLDSWGNRQFVCPNCKSTNIDELGTRVDGTWDCLCDNCDLEFEAEEAEQPKHTETDLA
jgi:transposase-like protein